MKRLHHRIAVASLIVVIGPAAALAGDVAARATAAPAGRTGINIEDGLAQARGPRGRGPRGGRGRRPALGQGRGLGRGPDEQLRADQAVFHYLLAHHKEIQRTVTRRDDGVETLTESDNPAVAAKIQEHVAAMHNRVKSGKGLRYWDDLFVALFDRHADITMKVEDTEKGVMVVETSEDPTVVPLIQAHADVVSLFVKLGFEEARREHEVPQAE